MDSYIELNKQIYDSIAKEYQQKISEREENNKFVTERFSNAINARFHHPKILELGPGSGHASQLLIEKSYDVTAIEFSPTMAKLAKEIAPKAKIIVGEFLSHDFKEQKYSGILGMGFIHLFNSIDSSKVLNKIYQLLEKNGVGHLTTTRNTKSEEGYFSKINFKNKPKRFRRKFTKNEFETELNNAGFQIISYFEKIDNEEENKTWMNFIFEKK
ncbi:MAG: class I SAM-dependent methyltransferase [archaeon]|nr:class I SAM-dependent methyltransferase [archaeon]